MNNIEKLWTVVNDGEEHPLLKGTEARKSGDGYVIVTTPERFQAWIDAWAEHDRNSTFRGSGLYAGDEDYFFEDSEGNEYAFPVVDDLTGSEEVQIQLDGFTFYPGPTTLVLRLTPEEAEELASIVDYQRTRMSYFASAHTEDERTRMDNLRSKVISLISGKGSN